MESEQQGRRRAGIAAFATGQDVHIDRGGGALLIARRDMHVSRGGGQWVVALRDQTIHQGGGAVLLSREARVSNGFVGLIVAGRVSLEGTARTLATISLPLVVAAATAFGLGILVGRRRSA